MECKTRSHTSSQQDSCHCRSQCTWSVVTISSVIHYHHHDHIMIIKDMIKFCKNTCLVQNSSPGQCSSRWQLERAHILAANNFIFNDDDYGDIPASPWVEASCWSWWPSWHAGVFPLWWKCQLWSSWCPINWGITTCPAYMWVFHQPMSPAAQFT